jgi:hypothetical protein
MDSSGIESPLINTSEIEKKQSKKLKTELRRELNNITDEVSFTELTQTESLTLEALEQKENQKRLHNVLVDNAGETAKEKALALTA